MNTTPFDPSGGVALFTDGSAFWKDRSGGFAWVALDSDRGIRKDSGFRENSTSNQMELVAVIEGLNALADELGEIDVLVYSDSEYVVLGATDSSRSRNKNKRLWNALEKAVSRHAYVEFNHVKGHNDSLWNEMVDQAAGAARKAGLEAQGKEAA